jgi:hypothetical protein
MSLFFLEIMTFLLSEHLVYFLMADQWVVLDELGLVCRAVVERAVVGLGVPVRPTVHIATLALNLHQAYFLFALPAQFLVCLRNRGLHIELPTYLYF